MTRWRVGTLIKLTSKQMRQELLTNNPKHNGEYIFKINHVSPRASMQDVTPSAAFTVILPKRSSVGSIDVAGPG